MARSYFIFNSVDSRDKGIFLRGPAPLIRPEERIKNVKIPGRGGSLTELEGEEIYEPYIQTVEMSVPGSQREYVAGWLRGDGYVTFSSDADRSQYARVIGAVTLEKISPHLNKWRAQVQFYCQPLKRKKPLEDDITLTSSGSTVNNPGSVKSKPKIKITGSGNMTIVIGGQTLVLTGVQTGWIIDANTGWITNSSGTPQYGVCEGSPEKIRLPLGNSTVTWDGSITKLEITPRWRYL